MNLNWAMMDDCMREGIMGRCGPECPVYKNGECEEPDEIDEWLEKGESDE